jgi:cytochrome b
LIWRKAIAREIRQKGVLGERQMQLNAGPSRMVLVWDGPTRLFHWLLFILVVVAWFTGEGEGAGAIIHRAAGSAIAGLIIFRAIWGFAGGEHARFADFAFAPGAALANLRQLSAGRAKSYLGHNPLGAVAVYLLLINIAVIVASGLFSAGETNAGPFAGAWGGAIAEIHETAFRVLQVLVSLHVLGVIVESIVTKDALARAMITGAKRRGLADPAADARRAAPTAFLFAAAIGLIVALALMTAPAGAPSASESAAADQAHATELDRGAE